MLFELVVWALIGAAVVGIIYKVAVIISRSNLGKIVRDALRSSGQKQAEELISKNLELLVKSKENNVIKLSALDKYSGKSVEIQIEGSGVDYTVYKGMKMAI